MRAPDIRHATLVAGPMLEAVRPERYVLRWRTEHGGTTVGARLRGAPAGNRRQAARARHPDTPQGRAALVEWATGWGDALTLLELYVEHGARC